MESNEVEQAYNLLAPTYDNDEANQSSGSVKAVEQIVVLSLLRNIEFQDVLDAGTGTGRYAIRLAQMGKHVVGIDVNDRMLVEARAKADRLGLSITFRRASVMAVPLADDSVDLAVCALVLAHVKDLAGAVRELVRVLRCGGHLIISDMHPNIQRLWGPDKIAAIQGGSLSTADCVEDCDESQRVPFPNYHGEIDEYLDSIRAAGAEVLAAIDVPLQQIRGLLPGPMVILARKH